MELGNSKLAGEAAHTAIKRKFADLKTAVTIGNIPDHLYQENLIDEDTFDYFTGSHTTAEKGQRILRNVQKKVKVNPGMFTEFHRILSDDDTTESLATTLQGVYKKEYEKRLAASKTSNEFEALKRQLETFKDVSKWSDPPEGLEEKAIHHYIEMALESGTSVDTIKSNLKSLCTSDVLLSSEMYKWAVSEVENVSNQQSKRDSNREIVPVAPPMKMTQPSLCPETLYHASLCCCAVNSCSRTNEVHDFFHQNRHKLQEASLSPQTETMDQYLIAKNGNTIYVAFRSKSTVTQWIQSKHNTFEEGLVSQAKFIPLRFFIEQLLKNQKIILTGFSFGGMLACCVAANLWRASILNTALLQKNVTCITFGQPLVGIPHVQEMTQNFPILEDTLHMIVNKEDPVPRLLYSFGIGCSIKITSVEGPAQNGSKPVKLASPMLPDSDRPPTDFRKAFNSKFLSALAALQEKQSVMYSSAVLSGRKLSQMLSSLKELLEIIFTKSAGKVGQLFGNIHLMMLESNGLTWKTKFPKQMVAEELNFTKSSIEKLDASHFKRHSMEDYHTKMLRSYLEKQHQDFVPSSTDRKKLQEVSLLRPIAASVEFHMYPDEHVIVLEGNNLWFCCKVSLGEDSSIKINSAPNNIMRRSVQFNFDPSPETESIVVDGEVTVTLHSHFFEPVTKSIQAKEEPYLFSLRQIQLAKHTPTELIQLAYCTAMLERMCHPSETGSLPSKRLELVKQFLEEAAKIVPLESVFYAIAYGGKDTALRCVKALEASGITFPPSLMMVTGVQLAEKRVRTGMTEEEYEKRELALDSMPSPAGWELPNDDLEFPDESDSIHAPPITPTNGSTVPEVSPFQGLSNFLGLPGAIGQYPSPPLPRHHPVITGPPRPSYSDIAAGQARSPSTIKEYISLTVLPVPIPVPVILDDPLDSNAAQYLCYLSKDIVEKALRLRNDLPVISNRSIEHFCPFSLRRCTMQEASLQSPIQALQEARDRLLSFVEESSNPDDVQTTLEVHTEMIKVVRDIRDHNLKTCASLLAAFMEQQIHIPMLKTNLDTANVLSAIHPHVAVGVWAFMSMGVKEIQEILSCSEGNSLLVEMEDYITGIMEYTNKPSEAKEKRKAQSDHMYAAKLQFMVAGIKKSPTVTCSKQYISYCLEHQLHELSEQLKFDKSVSVKELLVQWDSFFKDDALSLVAKSHRPLIARWLKWALLVHNLRETLASYTCVGIIGLSNSGKSLLVNTLFNLQTQVGTTESKRTVVPFLYNMEGKVDNLDIIDFPGVDDKDCVPELASLLVGLAQVVIFVVNYRKINSELVKEWLKRLEKEDNIHVHVCLTHADWLYNELEQEQGATNETKMVHLITGEMNNIKEKLGTHPSRTIRFCCFNLAGNTQLTYDMLKKVEIYSPRDVGEWLVQTIGDKLTQSKLASDLEGFFNRRQ